MFHQWTTVLTKVTADEMGGTEHGDTAKGKEGASNATENHNSEWVPTRFWELEDAEPQIRSPKAQSFILERCSACPPPILDCIENGYRLPIKFIPPCWSQQG